MKYTQITIIKMTDSQFKITYFDEISCACYDVVEEITDVIALARTALTNMTPHPGSIYAQTLDPPIDKSC